MRFTGTALAIAVLCLDIPSVTCTPVLPQQNAPNIIIRQVDCKQWGTPYSCDIFCYATLCLNLPSILTHDMDNDRQEQRRKESGNKNRPFSDAGVEKYQTIRRNNDPSFNWADEYPPASSKEGGDAATGRAIIQGATQDDQSRQGAWLNQRWQGIGDGDQVQLEVFNWDPQLSPYCEARARHDTTVCTGKPFNPYFRKSDVKGQHGKTVFDHLGV